SFSESWSKVEAAKDGVIKTFGLQASNLTLRFDGIQNSIPRAISTQSATGGVFDWRTLSNYLITTGGPANPQEARNGTTGARVSAGREFGRSLPFRVKVGADVRREARDFRNPNVTFAFVGPDRIANTADDSVSRYDLLADSWSRLGLPFGLGQFQRP